MSAFIVSKESQTNTDGVPSVRTTGQYPNVTIFYHAYIPPKSTDPSQFQRAKDIVTEQLHRLSASLARVPVNKSMDLFYTAVGEDINELEVQNICQNYTRRLHCHRRQHIANGFEDYTLQALYEHCVENPGDRVIYIHSKGSFHSNRGQDNWRAHMTDAVTSQECMEQGHSEDCDLCGLLFVTRPTHHYTGNMFNAKCSYVQKLVPPKYFAAKMDKVYRQAQKLVGEGTLRATLFELNQPWNSGTRRYAMEHWHASHPAAERICDVSNHSSNKFWKQTRVADRTPQDWQFGIVPRRPLPGLPLELEVDESLRKKEWFLLPGHLTKWFILYNETPGIQSWIWNSYQDGQFWKNQVQMHGIQYVQYLAGTLPTP